MSHVPRSPFATLRAGALLAGLLLAACSTAAPSATPQPTTALPRPSPTPEPTATPPATPEPATPSVRPSEPVVEGPLVATFLVAGQEEYRILLTDPADIELARAWQAGEFERLIPNGRIVMGDDGGVNTGYSWHIDPDDVELAEITVEVCDGLPSYIEDGLLSGDRFCPWSAELVSLEPYRG
ncbi:MAG TPA: hypothetical protein VFH63_07475 [candidate division Zixibacteria bacterium]|nr:hypothetical protein [candidate division Zixibacteria bacterium]